VRKKKRRPTSPLPEGDHVDLGSSPSPDEVLASVRLSDDVQAALLKLPYDFREAVVLCDVVGLTYEEIAEATDAPVGTVRSRIHRGRSMLRGMLTWPV
jgi:RNA polymerase sigma-70 factor (ECF subfamily)